MKRRKSVRKSTRKSRKLRKSRKITRKPPVSASYCKKTPVSKMGFTQRSSCKAQGLIKRSNGRKYKSPKYKN